VRGRVELGSVRAFHCPTCGQMVFFENTVCLSSGTPLGFDTELREMVKPDPARHKPCANAVVAACNWLLPAGDEHALCRSCRLTRTRPPDGDSASHGEFVQAEAAKRRLVFQLLELRLPVRSFEENERDGVTFDLLSSSHGSVTTGHHDGVITLDVSESDDVRREWLRRHLDEPYRTVLGHFRHEIGHYYWPMLVEQAGSVERASTVDEFRARFGDEREDYQTALDRHYGAGAPDDWPERYVSAYATMHPWEDWAETFAHVLHILDTLQTAASFGLRVVGEPFAREPLHEPFERVIDAWLPLTYALNAVNRSMGKDDLYPFVLGPTVLEKLAFVHDLVRDAAASARVSDPSRAT
jgi:hypothetical protein